MAITALLIASAQSTAAPLTDTLRFGDDASEKAHDLHADHGESIVGGLSEPARRLLPSAHTDWAGGTISFILKVDPAQQNYVTVRLWGEDVTNDRLVLYCDGKQIGYRHLGDIDILDYGTEAPGFNGRFYYNTSPLPIALTRGKTELHCEVRGTGPVWGYGGTFEAYQKPMTVPTRGIYAMYTHTDGYFTPPESEKQGPAPTNPPVRSSPGPEVIDALKQRLAGVLTKLMDRDKPPNQVEMHFLARAYHVTWTPAYHNPKAVEQIVKGCDELYAAYHDDPKLAEADPAVYNAGWFGMGLAGDAVRLLREPLAPFLDQPVPGVPGTTRRAGWSDMLEASRDYHRYHRRQYTNQSMITDLNIYRANRGVAAIDPAHALPEKQMLHYLYQALGVEPWLGSDTDAGPSKSAGDNFYELTAKGLSKELGYVGTYGEVLDWATQIYDATRDPGQPGDPIVKKQLEKIANARAVFRYPMLDAGGDRAMRLECVVGWRDAHMPGDVIYAERSTWDATALYTAAATLDPAAVGYSRQMFEDNQFFIGLADQAASGKSLRITAGLLGAPDQYETLRAQPPSSRRLPMTPGQPDFVWSDEEDGVVAIKHGDEILYTSLYWRARFAVNFLARVHHITPTISRIAVVREDAEFIPSGQNYTRQDWTNMAFAGGGLKYPGDLHSAHAGETLPIAKVPDGIPFKPGDENVYAGHGTYYQLRYGSYFIAMNCKTAGDHPVQVPADFTSAVQLPDGKAVPAGSTLTLPPRSTLVLYRPTTTPSH